VENFFPPTRLDAGRHVMPVTVHCRHPLRQQVPAIDVAQIAPMLLTAEDKRHRAPTFKAFKAAPSFFERQIVAKQVEAPAGPPIDNIGRD
jgi:hypothetical protein